MDKQPGTDEVAAVHGWRENRIAELERELAARCDHCGGKVTDYPHGCPGCSAPQCCQSCCDRDQLERQRDELRTALERAREDMESWAAYADEYFREKHDLAGDLAAIDKALEKSNGQ
jgi:hypothetical protein